MLSASAARVICWRSATATNTRSCSSVIARGYQATVGVGYTNAARGPQESPSSSGAAPRTKAGVLTAAEGGREPAALARGARRSGRQVRKIVDNRRDVLRVDWRLVRIPHLLDLGLPDGAGQARLCQNHAGGMASQTVVVDDIGPRAGKSAVAVRVVDADRPQRYAVCADRGWRRPRLRRGRDGRSAALPPR